MKKLFLLLLSVVSIGLFTSYYIGPKQVLKKDKQQIIYFAKVKRISSSSDMRFYWYDTELKQIKDVNNEYAWFFAFPTDFPDTPGSWVSFLEDNKNLWVSFFEDNKNSVFRITGNRGQDDCGYYGPDHCIENINIESIEVVRQKLPDTETADWQGKTTDWLRRTFDVNNPGKEFEHKDLKMVSSTGWTVSDDQYIIDNGGLEKADEIEGRNWDSSLKAKNILNEADLSAVQKQYFYDNNYVPRSVEHFDVTGDGVAETIVTSLTLGCGRCVNFYMTIFSTEGKYNMGTAMGAIIKTENGNGFYLISIGNYPNSGMTIYISKYKWDKSIFTEVAEKEVVMEHK